MRSRGKQRRDFMPSERGTAGIEFGLIVSVLLVLLLGIVDAASLIADRRDMGSALRSGAEYFIVGGTDATEAARLVNESWGSRPNGSSLSVSRTCFCSAAAHACDANCPDTSLPVAYHILTAAASFDGIMFNMEHSVEESVRIR